MVESTHDIAVHDSRVVKRYRSWAKGEPAREWHALMLLDCFAPGLAPKPLERSTEDGVPAVVMTRVPGCPLGERRLSGEELRGLGLALRELHSAVPPAKLQDVAERHWGPQELVAAVRPWADQEHTPVSPVVDSALSAARAWLRTTAGLDGPLEERAFTLADGNLGNFLWDGERCRVVDFEDSGVSDPAYEVADLVEHVSVTLRDLVDVDALVEVLELTPRQQERLRTFRGLFSVFWLLMLLPGGPAHARNPEGSVEHQARRVLALLDTGSRPG